MRNNNIFHLCTRKRKEMIAFEQVVALRYLFFVWSVGIEQPAAIVDIIYIVLKNALHVNKYKGTSICLKASNEKITTSPSALFRSSSFCFACSSAIRVSIATNDSRVKGRNKLRSSSEIESESSVIVYTANDESLRFRWPVGEKGYLEHLI